MSRISTVRSGPGGTILVGQYPDDTTILVFSGTGQRLRRIGRSGTGPGDISSLDMFGVLGDTVWVADNGLGRFTYFDIQGRVLRTTRADTGRAAATRRLLAGDTGLANWQRPFTTSLPFLGPSERAFAQLSIGYNHPIWNHAAAMPLFAATRTGTPLAVLAALPRRHSVLAVETNISQAFGYVATNQPFSDDPTFAISSGGKRLVVAASSVSGATGTVRLTHIAPTGDTLARHSVSFTPSPIPTAYADSVIAARTKGLRGAPPPGGWRAHAYVPPNHTGVTSIVASDNGTVWIRPYCAGPRCVWTVVGPTGRVVGTVDLPSRTSIAAVDEGGVWAIERDDDGLESVARYRVGPAAGRGSR